MNTQLSLNHLPPTQWLRQCGMQRDQVMPALYEALKTRPQPDVFVIHPRENDLVACSTVQLPENLKQDISLIKDLISGTRHNSAGMLPRCIWRGVISNKP